MRPMIPDRQSAWTEDEARRILESWQRSGDTLAAFARKLGVGASRLYYWKKRLSSPTPTERPALSLIRRPGDGRRGAGGEGGGGGGGGGSSGVAVAGRGGGRRGRGHGCRGRRGRLAVRTASLTPPLPFSSACQLASTSPGCSEYCAWSSSRYASELPSSRMSRDMRRRQRRRRDEPGRGRYFVAAN